jgi:hypothetical protein
VAYDGLDRSFLNFSQVHNDRPEVVNLVSVVAILKLAFTLAVPAAKARSRVFGKMQDSEPV